MSMLVNIPFAEYFRVISWNIDYVLSWWVALAYQLLNEFTNFAFVDISEIETVRNRLYVFFCYYNVI